jgi:hypothetical protein
VLALQILADHVRIATMLLQALREPRLEPAQRALALRC